MSTCLPRDRARGQGQCGGGDRAPQGSPLRAAWPRGRHPGRRRRLQRVVRNPAAGYRTAAAARRQRAARGRGLPVQAEPVGNVPTFRKGDKVVFKGRFLRYDDAKRVLWLQNCVQTRWDVEPGRNGPRTERAPGGALFAAGRSGVSCPGGGTRRHSYNCGHRSGGRACGSPACRHRPVRARTTALPCHRARWWSAAGWVRPIRN